MALLCADVPLRNYSVSHLCDLQRKSGEVRAQRSQLKQIEDLSAGLEERLILDNRYVLLVIEFCTELQNQKVVMYKYCIIWHCTSVLFI